MHNWNNLTFEERVSEWRSFRDRMGKCTPNDLIRDTASFFSSFPISPRVLDYYSPETWFTPWEIFKNSYFCRSCVSLLIYHTIKISKPDININLTLIDDGSDKYLVTIVDDSTVINYYIGQTANLSEIQTEIKVIDTFSPDSYN